MLIQKIVSWINPGAEQQKEGKIKFFNRRKGYGFIESESLERDVFVHVTNLEDFVSRGDKVSFEVERSKKGLEAKNVRRLAKGEGSN